MENKKTQRTKENNSQEYLHTFTENGFSFNTKPQQLRAELRQKRIGR